MSPLRDWLFSAFSSRRRLERTAHSVYNYHNLGVGVFPEGEEKTPCGSGERYNYDRMALMVAAYDFTAKNVVDLGCNSGWFCLQAKLLGSNVTVGIDYSNRSIMSGAIKFARAFEKHYRFGMNFVNADIETVDFRRLAGRHGLERFDVALVLSVLHHISDKQRLFEVLFDAVRDVIFYEDHEFWNDMRDAQGRPIEVKGEGYRFGWNEDMSWQRKIHSLEFYEDRILDDYRSSWRKDALLLDRFHEVRFLGFSEKRRPVLALFKRDLAADTGG